MYRMLIIGYGNPYRCDDGVALAVINELRRLRGHPPMEEGADGMEDLGKEVDTIFLQQLTPELAEIVAHYDEVIFVDAHMGKHVELIRETALKPMPHSAIISHHLHPEALLALSEALWGRTPKARLVSIQGHNFDFGTDLSPKTQEGSRQAVARIWDILNSR